MKSVLKVRDRMTLMPIAVNPDLSIQDAWSLMRQKQVRHLPVEEGGKFVGILSERTLKLATSYEGSDRMTARDVMVTQPYIVDPGTPLFEVALYMAEHRYGSAVVVEGGKVIGIFTTVDALRTLGEFLESEWRKVA